MATGPAGPKLTVSVEHYAFKAPFRITGHVFDAAPVLVATLERGRAIGRGEACGVYYMGETVETAAEALRAVSDRVAQGVTREALLRLLPPGGARNALDCALWDLEAQEAGQPAWRLAGLELPQPLTTTQTLGADTPGAMAAAALAVPGSTAIKVKLTGDVDADTARVRAVRAARPDVWLGVDTNQGYVPDTLDRLVATLVECRVSLLEQPFARGREADMDGLRLPMPTAADESCLDLAELDQAIGRFDVVNIKLDKCGGLTEALLIAAKAKAHGMGVMVGCMLGTTLANAPAFLLGQLCSIVDLDAPTFLSADREPTSRYENGKVFVPPEAWGSGKPAAP